MKKQYHELLYFSKNFLEIGIELQRKEKKKTDGTIGIMTILRLIIKMFI